MQNSIFIKISTFLFKFKQDDRENVTVPSVFINFKQNGIIKF